MSDENKTMLDLVFHDGRLMKKIEDRNGEVRYEPVREEGNTDPFADTETVPAPWEPETREALFLPKEHLTREQHADRSLRIEAALVKAFSPRMRRGGNTDTVDTNGNGALKELLKDLCLAMGGEWAKRVGDIK